METVCLIGGVVALGALAVLAAKFFPNEIAEFMRRLGAPSEFSVKKQSDEMLVDMDRNVAERKARQGR